jgi:hypothetical protein
LLLLTAAAAAALLPNQAPAEDGLDLIGEELEEASAAVEGLSQVRLLQNLLCNSVAVIHSRGMNMFAYVNTTACAAPKHRMSGCCIMFHSGYATAAASCLTCCYSSL